MKRIILLLCALMFSCGVARAQVFNYPHDIRGGATNQPCTNGATGHWYLQLVGSTWYQCTDFGNRIFLAGATTWNIPSTGTVFTGKYGGSIVTATNDTFNEATTWGFNTLAGNVFPTSSTPLGGSCAGACIGLPTIAYCLCDEYSSTNLLGLATQATLFLARAYDTNFPAQHSNSLGGSFLADAFSPYFAQHQTGYAPNIGNLNNAFVIGATIADTIPAGPDFDSFANGHNATFQALTVLFAPPIQTGTTKSVYSPQTVLYPDPLLYSKVPMASPPTTCALTHGNECSEATLFQKEYGTIAALNAAWGSSYTCFGSSADQYGWAFTWAGTGCGATNNAAISVGTGNGSLLSFNVTVPTNVDPYSIEILVAGSPVGFDCPVWNISPSFNNPASSCSGSNGTGLIVGPNLSGGAITYATGVMSIVFNSGHAPANGAAVTAKLMANGWGTPAGGTGLMDEDGRHTAWLGTADVCLKTVHVPFTEGTDSYACRTGNPGSYKDPSTSPATNQNYAADAYTLDANLYAKYFDVMRTAFKATWPNSELFSPVGTGAWNIPPAYPVLDGANAYMDVLWMTILPQSQQQAANIWSYVGNHFIGPWMNESFFSPCADSAVAAGNSHGACEVSPPGNTSQVISGQLYYTLFQQMLSTTLGSDGKAHWIGNARWSYNDCDSDNGHTSWGVKSCGAAQSLATALTDNAYDGHEAASGPVGCSVPNTGLQCGNEPVPGGSAVRPFGNGLTCTLPVQCVQTANAQWVAGSSSGAAVSLGCTTLMFQHGTIGVPSAQQICSVTNTGSANLIISSITLSAGGQFSFVTPSSGTNCLTSGTVAPSGSCNVALIFTSNGTGPQSAVVTIVDNATPPIQSFVVVGGVPSQKLGTMFARKLL